MLKNSSSKQIFQSMINWDTRRNWLCIVQAVEIKQVGEILHATNVKSHYIKLIVKVKHLIVNVMKLMSRSGW